MPAFKEIKTSAMFPAPGETLLHHLTLHHMIIFLLNRCCGDIPIAVAAAAAVLSPAAVVSAAAIWSRVFRALFWTRFHTRFLLRERPRFHTCVRLERTRVRDYVGAHERVRFLRARARRKKNEGGGDMRASTHVFLVVLVISIVFQ